MPESGESYSYVPGADGEPRLPESMEGDLAEISLVTKTDKLRDIKLKLNTGVVITLPPEAEGNVCHHIKSGDHFEISTSRLQVGDAIQTFEGVKDVRVSRGETSILTISLNANSILLD